MQKIRFKSILAKNEAHVKMHDFNFYICTNELKIQLVSHRVTVSM